MWAFALWAYEPAQYAFFPEVHSQAVDEELMLKIQQRLASKQRMQGTLLLKTLGQAGKYCLNGSVKEEGNKEVNANFELICLRNISTHWTFIICSKNIAHQEGSHRKAYRSVRSQWKAFSSLTCWLR